MNKIIEFIKEEKVIILIVGLVLGLICVGIILQKNQIVEPVVGKKEVARETVKISKKKEIPYLVYDKHGQAFEKGDYDVKKAKVFKDIKDKKAISYDDMELVEKVEKERCNGYMELDASEGVPIEDLYFQWLEKGDC